MSALLPTPINRTGLLVRLRVWKFALVSMPPINEDYSLPLYFNCWNWELTIVSTAPISESSSSPIYFNWWSGQLALVSTASIAEADLFSICFARSRTRERTGSIKKVLPRSRILGRSIASNSSSIGVGILVELQRKKFMIKNGL